MHLHDLRVIIAVGCACNGFCAPSLPGGSCTVRLLHNRSLRDIKDVRKDLGLEIAKGARATEELKQRMDKSNDTFAESVAAVVANLPGGACASDATVDGGSMGPSASMPSSSSMSYATCASILPTPIARPSKEDLFSVFGPSREGT